MTRMMSIFISQALITTPASLAISRLAWPIIIALHIVIQSTHAFSTSSSWVRPSYYTTTSFISSSDARTTTTALTLSSPTSVSAPSVDDAVNLLQTQIDDCIQQKQHPELYLQQLEALNTDTQPNRSANYRGTWYVWYSNAPPPSNGLLGPFRGIASQVIPTNTVVENEKSSSSQSKPYQNILTVPPNDWLTATLDGIWEEWDGQIMEGSEDVKSPVISSSSSPIDWGACHWKVTFRQLQLRLFGFLVLQQTFPPNTSRIWRTTYLDDEIRIVRAGRTGRVEDEFVFYTRRTPPPNPT